MRRVEVLEEGGWVVCGAISTNMTKDIKIEERVGTDFINILQKASTR